MKIENLIDDIKADIQELAEKLEHQLKHEMSDARFLITLPGIEELNTIKTIALSIEEHGAIFYLTVQVHTHNGNRVFENAPKQIIDGQAIHYPARHPFQDRFVDLLRDIIKRKKNGLKTGNRMGQVYNDLLQFAKTA